MADAEPQAPDDLASGRPGDAPAVAKRGEAVGCGWGCGSIAVAGVVAVGSLIGDGLSTNWLLPMGALAVIVGVVVRGYAAGADRTSHLRERAPRLPIALAAVDEPVWIRASVECPQPVVAPHFGVPCVWLRVTVVRGTGKHKKTLRDDRTAARAWLVDAPEQGGGRVELELSKVALHQIPSWSAREGNETTTIAFLPARGLISACGVLRRERRRASPPVNAEALDVRRTAPPTASVTDVDDTVDGRLAIDRGDEPPSTRLPAIPGAAEHALVLRGEGELPLLVTPLARSAWTEHIETEEVRTRTVGTALLVCGSAVVATALGALLDLWPIDEVLAWVVGPLAAVLLVAPWIARAALRRVRECRTRAEDAAAALEADLARAADDPSAAGLRVAARLAVYDQLATEHNELLCVAPMTWVGRFARCEPLPIHGDGNAAGGAGGAPPAR